MPVRLRDRKRERIVNLVAMFIAELGYVPTLKQFDAMRNRPWGINKKTIKNSFTSWGNLLSIIERTQPELWALANPKAEEPKVNIPSAVDDAAEVMSQPDPLATLRASTTENQYG